MRPPARPEVEAVCNHVGLAQQVVEERRRLVEIRTELTHFAEIGRAQQVDPHRSGDALPRGNLPGDVAQEVAGGE